MSARALPPGPPGPVALHSARWLLRPMPFLERARARYGDVFTIHIGNEPPWVVLADPDAVREVFTGDPEVLHAGEANQVLLPLVGRRSVLLLDERPHLHQRKLLLPPFHGERMRRYRELMTEVAEAEVARWPRGEPVALWRSMQDITLEIILRAVFGMDVAAERDRVREPLRGLLDWTMSPARLLFFAALGPRRLMALPAYRRARERVDVLLYEQIRRRRADPGVAGRDDVLSLLVQARDEDGEPMSDEELRDELVTLLVAGHETTATSLSWALERLVRHPAALERLREEVESGEEAYLDAVVKETMRLRPVLPVVVRKLTRPLELAGHHLPAGCVVAPCIALIHRREDVYPEPHRFRPERFLEQPAGTYTWLPFGGGVRRCIGASFALLEMQLVLAAVVRGVDLRAARPEPERIARRAITLTPARGGEVVVGAR